MCDWHHEGLLKPLGNRPGLAVKRDGYREAPGKDGAWMITGVVNGELLWTRWLKRAPKKGKASAADLPAWIRRRRVPPHTPKSEVVAAVVRCIGSITERQVNTARCKGNADEVLGLWRSLDHPALPGFAAEVALVALAARECPDGLFALDIRNEGREGPDRRHSVATLCVQRKWEERLTAAQSWQEKVGAARTPTTAEYDEEQPPPRQEWS